ncbi:MAG: TatD family hydrolase [Chloroflexota bacterium]
MAENPNPTHAPLIDTHAHLDFDDYGPDLPEVIHRARDFGLTSIVTIGIEPMDWRRTLEFAEQHSGVFPAIGIHPNSADQTTDATLADLESLCRSNTGKKVVAIGETGLDFYRDHVAHDVQRASFRAQLELARQLDLPVIIHDRDAHESILEILKADGRGTRGVMHSFSGDLDFARECISLGYMISLAGPVTFRKATDKHAIAREVPLDWLLVETDCPFLTPEPYRGRRNEPAYVAYTAKAIADLRGTSLDIVAKATTDNARRLFGLPLATEVGAINAGGPVQGGTP